MAKHESGSPFAAIFNILNRLLLHAKVFVRVDSPHIYTSSMLSHAKARSSVIKALGSTSRSPVNLFGRQWRVGIGLIVVLERISIAAKGHLHAAHMVFHMYSTIRVVPLPSRIVLAPLRYR